MAQAFGADRRAAGCREPPKTYEEVRRGGLAELADWAADGVRGEITVVVAGAAPTVTSLEEALPGIRERAARGERLKEVCADVAVTTGLSKKALYDAAVSDKTGVAPASPRL
jgi:16S rRNA (cytidine1402-2'-O)-methyltransferase